jgi:hypothetical protein
LKDCKHQLVGGEIQAQPTELAQHAKAHAAGCDGDSSYAGVPDITSGPAKVTG